METEKKKCEICFKSFINLKHHLKNMHSFNAKLNIYNCDHCGQKFFKKLTLIKHIEFNHKSENLVKFECDFDGKIFMTRQKLLIHMKNHQSFEKCEICGIKIKHLKSHLLHIHQRNDDNLQCSLCDKKFKHKINLNAHMKTHNKQFQCKICGQKLSTNSLLSEHLKHHDGEFRCKACLKNFTAKSSLKTHLKTHDKNRPKPLKCPHCDYSTDGKHNLKRHLKTHSMNREKPLECPNCVYKTDYKINLKRHLQIHNPYRVKFPCLYCNYEATERVILKNHTKRYHLQE